MKNFYDDFKLGIIGGGQLGRMFIQEAINFNVDTLVLDPDDTAPCKNICNSFFQGSLKEYKSVYEFGKNCDLVTIEFEHINIEALEQLKKDGITVYPQPEVLKLIQDKGLQKEFYKEKGIPTADYILTANRNDVETNSSFLPCFHKLRKSGYDGRGVVKISGKDDIGKAFDEPGVLEKYIPFEKEISVIVARNEHGEIRAFPITELEFNPEANLVEYLFSPANVSDDIAEKAKQIALKVANELNIVGVLAVEMFLTKGGEILVNEIAPRPHNSGHQSIEANITSQYEQHLRAILGLPLGSTNIIMPSVMVNLLGEKNYEGHAKYEGLNEVMKMEGVKVHLYGKKFTKPFRKMGHVTIIDQDPIKAKEKAVFVKKTLKVIAE